MNKWQKFIIESPGYRKRVQSYVRDRDKMLNKGGQKNSPPFTKKMGSHVTFEKLREEDVDPETFEKQPELDPKIWQDGMLNKNISKRLTKIANEFLSGLEIGATMEDLRLTGSMANYNWSKYSDIDLHIVVGFSKIDENTELVKSFFDGAIWRWNELHGITIYGHEVEIFVENVGHVTHSGGIYSIMNNEWVSAPDPEKVEFDYVTARKKADATQTEINMIEKFAYAKPMEAVESINRLKKRIRRMRRAGLHSPAQEYSAENIAFKILRREEALDKLNHLKYNAYDRALSVGLGVTKDEVR